MTYRSSRFRKTKQTLAQGPATSTAPTQSWSPVPLDGDPRRPARNFADPRQLPGLERMTASDGLTVMMPAARPAQSLSPIQAAQSVENLTATQILPPVSEMLPPSACHANPANWYARTVVEDENAGSSTPSGRGRHVLAELKALPDPSEELAAAEQRVVSAMVTGVPQVKNPALRLAVRMFREARDMARVREQRCDQDSARLDAADARIRAFAERWAHDDAHWDRVAAALKAKQEASDAGLLTSAYEADGTAAALYKVDELSQVIVQRALAGSAVSA